MHFVSHCSATAPCSSTSGQRCRSSVDEGKSLDQGLATNLTTPYDATTLGDTKQSNDRFITEVYDEAKDFLPM